MRVKVLIAVAVVVALCATAALTQGGPRPDGRDGRGKGGGPMACPVGAVMPPPAAVVANLTTELGLTDQQATDLTTLLSASDATIQPLMETLRETSRSLRDGLAADTYDAAAMTDLATKAAKTEAEIIASSIDTWAKIRGILTADQVAQMMTKPRAGCLPPPGTPPLDPTSGNARTGARGRR